MARGRELVAEPDADDGEEDGDEGAVDLEGVFDDEEAVLDPLECGDEDAADQADDEDVALHGLCANSKRHLLLQKSMDGSHAPAGSL